MRFARNKSTKRNFWPLLVVIFFGILAARSLIFQDGYFNMHDDLQMMRQLQFEKCFLDGQVPCRWVPDMGYGFGFPLFNFYPPLPYLIGQVFRLLGATFVDTAKYTFALAFMVSGVTMYYLAKEFFGRIGGVLASVFYIWAPYHAVDIYVRGAMNEAWSLVWFPLILWSSYKLITLKDRKWIVALMLSYAALLLTHNLMVLIFTPIMGVWILLHLFLTGHWKKVKPLLISGVWAIGLAAFFTLPAALENKFTQIQGQLIGYYDYTAHFVSIRQLLFSRFWGYGASVWLEADEMSFQVGHIHWILSLLIGLVLFFLLIKKYKENKGKAKKLVAELKKSQLFVVTSYMFIVGWIAAFMTHSKSIFIWKAIPQLRLTQFSWRFLALVIFAFSFLIGYIPSLLRSQKRLFNFALTPLRIAVAVLLIILLVAFNWNYFQPEGGEMGPLTDEQKFSDFAWDLQQTAGIYDYLPSTAVMAPRAPMSQLAEIMEGEAIVMEEKAGTDWGEFRIEVKSDEAVIRIGIFEFPGWKIYIDGQEADKYLAEDEEWGRMYIDLPQGLHNVRAEFQNTPIRSVGNIVSIISWGGLIVVIVNEKKKRKRN